MLIRLLRNISIHNDEIFSFMNKTLFYIYISLVYVYFVIGL